MLAIEIREPGEPDVLVPADRPQPVPAAGEVLIITAAAGVNRPDVFQRRGRYPPPPGASDIPGLEIAGTIAEIGEGVSDWRAGDRVCALVAGGGYAEFCVAPAPQCLPVPRGLDVVAAAAVPETFFTVWTNVFERADKCAACERLGADRCINYREADFVGAIKSLTSGRGVDVVLDMVGADYFARNLDALAMDGRLVEIATLSGAKTEINIQTIMQRRLTVTGSTLRARAVAEKGAIAAAVRREVWPLLESGAVKPIVFKTFPLRQAADAHRLMESSAHIGKIVLVIE